MLRPVDWRSGVKIQVQRTTTCFVGTIVLITRARRSAFAVVDGYGQRRDTVATPAFISILQSKILVVAEPTYVGTSERALPRVGVDESTKSPGAVCWLRIASTGSVGVVVDQSGRKRRWWWQGLVYRDRTVAAACLVGHAHARVVAQLLVDGEARTSLDIIGAEALSPVLNSEKRVVVFYGTKVVTDFHTHSQFILEKRVWQESAWPATLEPVADGAGLRQ